MFTMKAYLPVAESCVASPRSLPSSRSPAHPPSSFLSPASDSTALFVRLPVDRPSPRVRLALSLLSDARLAHSVADLGCRRSLPSAVFSHWEPMNGTVSEKGSKLEALCKTIRKRKGLKEEVPVRPLPSSLPVRPPSLPLLTLHPSIRPSTSSTTSSKGRVPPHRLSV